MKTSSEDWDFNDDRNGSWTIDTEDNSYRFQLVNNQWNMIDKNGDTVDMFPIFSTLDEDKENPNHTSVGDDNGNENYAVGIAENRTEKPSESLDNSDGKVSANSTERATDIVPMRSENSAMPIVTGILAVVGIGVGGAVLYKKRK